MYIFQGIETSYDFTSVVTFANGNTSSFHKVEHIYAQQEKQDFSFTMKGSTDETFDGKTPEDWAAIVLEFGKALYPINLSVSEQGDFMAVDDFEGVKQHWKDERQRLVDYYNNYWIEKESNRYALALKTEEKFYRTLKENMFYRLFFWREGQTDQQVVVRDFPLRARLSIFTFQGKSYDEKGGVCYDTYQVNDEGSGRLLGGHAKLQLYRDKDGLPNEIKLWARVEETDTGYFTKEITIKRI